MQLYLLFIVVAICTGKAAQRTIISFRNSVACVFLQCKHCPITRIFSLQKSYISLNVSLLLHKTCVNVFTFNFYP